MYWYRINNQYNSTSQTLCDQIKKVSGKEISPDEFDRSFIQDGEAVALRDLPETVIFIECVAEYEEIPQRVVGRLGAWCAIGEYSAVLFRTPDNYHHRPFVAVCTVDARVMTDDRKQEALRQWRCDEDDILCLKHDFDLWEAEIAAGRFLTKEERHEIDGKYNFKF